MDIVMDIKIEVHKLSKDLNLTRESDCKEFYSAVAARFGKLGLDLETESKIAEAAQSEVEGHYLLALDR